MPSPSQPTDVFRILDANANRASEGFRVVEDFVRFGWDDRLLARLCKEMRHRLTELLLEVKPEGRTFARDTTRDVGTEISTEGEYARDSLQQVAEASLKRIQQSLRCIEEFAKLAFPEVARNTERLRYECYTLEKAIFATGRGRRSLSPARLYVLVDGGQSPADFQARVAALVAVGVHMLQLRDKRLGDRELLERARSLRAATRATDTLCVVNDRPDLTLLADADGVHVGQEELSVKDVRRVIGVDRLIGVSTHCLEQARQAVLDGANYIGVGPMFASATKSFEQIPGPPLLAAVTSELSLPAFAIGGVNAENLAQISAAGCQRVAISSMIWRADDPAQAAKQILELLD